MADELKAQGNAAFSAGKYDEAIGFFTQAIGKDVSNHVLYSNRSAAYASLDDFERALEDGKRAVELKSDWPKGYSRVGAAYHGLRKWEDAMQAYEDGLKLDPSNEQLKAGMDSAEREAMRAVGGGGGGGGMFGGPEFMAKLAADPTTRAYLAQPDFVRMMSDIQTNPQNMGNYMQDPRFSKALEVALGVRIATPDEFMQDGEDKAGVQQQQQQQQEQQEQERNGEEAAAAKQETAQQPMEEEPPSEEQQALAAAMAEKEAGNAAYKAKRLEEALGHYNRALELAFDLSFLTNRAAVHFEMGQHELCIKDCEQAVEKGREARADYKIIGRALTRKGNALAKLGRLEEAIDTYQKALTEHRNAETLKRLHEAERVLKERTEAAYVDLDACNAEREAGNEAFKAMDYPKAVKHYTEALKRGPPAVNPDAYKLFSNRAACYTKLGAMPEALKDADECIALAPTFAKGYSRKAAAQFFMKDHEKALETYQAGLEHDPESQELKDGARRCMESLARFASGNVSEEEMQQRRARSMQDPEVQALLRDPVMNQVLKDFEENPTAAQGHLRNAAIRTKLNKLVAAGIIRMG